MHLHAKGPRPARHGLTDPAHAQNAQTAPADPSAHQGRRRPAIPIARLHHRHALGHAAGHGEDQRHGHIGGIVGQHAGGVRHQHATLARGGDINVIDPGPVIGDQLEPLARLGDQRRVDLIGDGGHQHIGLTHRRAQFLAGHRPVIFAQGHVKQL